MLLLQAILIEEFTLGTMRRSHSKRTETRIKFLFHDTKKNHKL